MLHCLNFVILPRNIKLNKTYTVGNREWLAKWVVRLLYEGMYILSKIILYI